MRYNGLSGLSLNNNKDYPLSINSNSDFEKVMILTKGNANKYSCDSAHLHESNTGGNSNVIASSQDEFNKHRTPSRIFRKMDKK